MKKKKNIELIARGVLVNNNKILLVRKKNGKHAFLPGGHIERGESAKEALGRELKEEIGFHGKVGGFLGAVEHAWEDRGRYNQEINLIFLFRCKPLCRKKVPRSCERQLEFFWHPLNDLRAVDLQPWVLRKLLPDWVGAISSDRWGSTL